jgi:hypothetical protein
VVEPEAVEDEAAGCWVGAGVGSSAATLGVGSEVDSTGVAGVVDWAGFAAALYDRTIVTSRCLSSYSLLDSWWTSKSQFSVEVRIDKTMTWY